MSYHGATFIYKKLGYLSFVWHLFHAIISIGLQMAVCILKKRDPKFSLLSKMGYFHRFFLLF